MGGEHHDKKDSRTTSAELNRQPCRLGAAARKRKWKLGLLPRAALFLHTFSFQQHVKSGLHGRSSVFPITFSGQRPIKRDAPYLSCAPSDSGSWLWFSCSHVVVKCLTKAWPNVVASWLITKQVNLGTVHY